MPGMTTVGPRRIWSSTGPRYALEGSWLVGEEEEEEEEGMSVVPPQ